MKVSVGPKKLRFVCPKDGEISVDDVAFLCNNCQESEVELRGEIYVCPSCLKEGQNFECMICQSKDVHVVYRGREQRHL